MRAVKALSERAGAALSALKGVPNHLQTWAAGLPAKLLELWLWLSDLTRRTWFHLAAALLGLAIFGLSWQTDHSLHQIHEQLTTRYIGEYPGSPFLEEITRILAEARESIDIACDFPGYGSYSIHSSYLKYQKTLVLKRNALKKGQIRLMVASRNRCAALIALYFPDSMSMGAVRQTQPFQDLVRRYPHHKIESPADIRRVNEEEQEEALRELATPETRRRDEPMPLHLWIVDKSVAVFAIPHETATGTEEGAFLTRDTNLIGKMKTIFDSYWNARRRSRGQEARTPGGRR